MMVKLTRRGGMRVVADRDTAELALHACADNLPQHSLRS